MSLEKPRRCAIAVLMANTVIAAHRRAGVAAPHF